MSLIGPVVSEEIFVNVDGRTDDGQTDGRTMDAEVIGILITHLRALGLGELKIVLQA